MKDELKALQQAVDSYMAAPTKMIVEVITMELTAQIKQEIGEFLLAAWSDLIDDAKEYGAIDLTVASDGESWNYQTGDNSFTGGAYGLPHWAVVTFTADSDARDIAEDIICQLEELMEY
jgi:hypothetical protein